MVRACGFVLLLACVPALAGPAGDAPGHQAADRGRRPVGEDARRPAPLRSSGRSTSRSGGGRGSGSATPPPGRPTRNRSRPTASRSGRSSASSIRACPRRWSASATTTTRPWWPRTTRFRVYQVRWPVLEGVHGEGLLLEPKGEVRRPRHRPARRGPDAGAGRGPRARRRGRSRSSPGGWRRTASASWSRP